MKPRGRSPRPPAFRDRTDAGLRLAERLLPAVGHEIANDLVVIGLVRGGVVVAAEVARLLGTRLEALVVRKLGAPRQPELAIGAVTAGQTRVLNRPLIQDLGISPQEVEAISDRARDAAIELAQALRVPTVLPDLTGKVAILVDDGLATGATMRVAVDAAAARNAARIIVAVPVAPLTMIEPFRRVADDVIAIVATDQLNAVGRWYERFDDVPTSVVRIVLDDARRSPSGEA
jgi:putative phosphoribosyl transferase